MSDSLLHIGILLQQAILPVIIIIGIVGNSLNIVVLTRRTLYHHACSRYFLALAINNLFYSSFIFINNLLVGGYQINFSNYSTISCKLVNYIGTISSFLSPYLIVLASMDRCCATSASAQIRKFSSVRVTHWMMFIVAAVFSLFCINILVMANLQPERGFVCAVEASTIYSQVYIITQVFLFAVVPPSLMMVFGLITIQHSNHSRVVPIAISRFNRTENQLAQMLFLQISTHIMLTLPTSVTYLISVLPNTIRTTSIFSFVSTICQIFFSCSYVTPFFLYVLSGRVYRKELFRLIHITFTKRNDNRVEPSLNQTIVVPAIQPTHTRLTPSHY
jgi:hypothetical protein